MHSTFQRLLALMAAIGLLAVACGSDSTETGDTSAPATDEEATDVATGDGAAGEGDAGSGEDADAATGEVDSIRLGYSAWPGWFPLAVTEQAGIFEEVGLDVDLVFFADYLASIDAMAAGELDGVTQTLNDTMASVAFGDSR
jgi:ABC-type nitrate/sulfonate/bicarbonate transport system substrate-binding protein